MTDRGLDDATAVRLAEALLEAARRREPIGALTDAHPSMTPADAYAVQAVVAERRREAGETVIGWKLGLTSAAMQQQLGVDQPDYGPLLTGHELAPGATVPVADFIAPRVEAEIAFYLRRPLRGPGVSRDDVLAATERVAASLELIDSRIANWKIKLADTIADMASSARIIVSADRRPLDGLDLGAERVVVEKNGERVAEGLGSAVLGDPVAAVAWAANTLGPLGVTLEPGHVVMPGAMHASVPVVAGDEITARFEHLGPVSVRFA